MTVVAAMEFVPIIFAFITILICPMIAQRYYQKYGHTHDALLLACLGMCVLTAMTLIALQLKWYSTYHIEGEIISTVIVSHGWTIHNVLKEITSLMLCFLFYRRLIVGKKC